MREIDKIIMERRPIFCKSCSGKLYYQNGGLYICEDCSQEELDEFGKIKKYLDENGPSPAVFISRDTGVAMEVIDIFLKNVDNKEKGKMRFIDSKDKKRF